MNKLKKLLQEEVEETIEDLTSKNTFLKNEIVPEETDDTEDINLDFLFQDVVIGTKSTGQEKTYTKLVRPEQEFFIPELPRKTALELFKEAANLADSKEEQLEIENAYLTNGEEIKIETVRQMIEGALFVMGSDGLNLFDLKRVTGLPLFVVKVIMEEMIQIRDRDPNSGLVIRQFGNKYKLLTKKELHSSISAMLNKKERKPLSDSVMEILAIIAYNQPCTRGIIEKVRDRDPSAAIIRLQDLGLIERSGRSTAPGKPWLYVVTAKFYDLFGLKSLSELPKVDRQQKYEEEVDIFARDYDVEE